MRPSDWLEHPIVEMRDPQGVPSALVRLRNRAPAYSVQPNERCLVFVHLAEDHWPVAIELLEPVRGRAVFDILTSLVETPFGEARAIDSRCGHAVIELGRSELAALFRAIGAAQESLEPSGVP